MQICTHTDIRTHTHTNTHTYTHTNTCILAVSIHLPHFLGTESSTTKLPWHFHQNHLGATWSNWTDWWIPFLCYQTWRWCFDGKIVYAMIIDRGFSVAMLPIIHKAQEAKYTVCFFCGWKRSHHIHSENKSFLSSYVTCPLAIVLQHATTRLDVDVNGTNIIILCYPVQVIIFNEWRVVQWCWSSSLGPLRFNL